MRVLLVEDDEMIGATLQQALEGAGWSVDWVRDGIYAQNAWSEGGYSCVLLDLGLPRDDGLQVLRRARGRGDATHEPVSDCHHVSTNGTSSRPTCARSQRQASGLMDSPTEPSSRMEERL